jgi:methionyl aminopeptidase
MSIREWRDWNGLRESGRVVRACLDAMAASVAPGVTTADLNRIGARVLARERARAAPRHEFGFPGDVCISVDDEVVHGIPSSSRRLRSGSLVKLDVTAEKGGYVTDAAITVVVGEASRAQESLIACARRAFALAMVEARAGNPVHAIGRAIEAEAARSGYSVVEGLAGHGTGRAVHEPPTVPNVFDASASDLLEPGLVIAVEPLIAAGRGAAVRDADGWTIRTRDGSLAAHHEHTIVVTEGAPIVLTAGE